MKFLLIYVPNLRFSFEEDWCTSTIGENFRLSSGLTPSTKEKAYFNNGIIPWINSGELKNKYISSTENKLTLDAVKKHNLTIYPMDTMVIAIYGLEAAGVRGKASITKMDSTISQSCMAFNSLGNVLTQFMYYVYKKEAQILGTRYAQGTKQQNLSSDLLSSYKLLYPSKEEQLKIVNFLSLIDEKIETQIKIINDLKAQKNYIIHSIFSKLNSKLVLITDIAEIYQPQTISSANFDESAEFPVFGANGIIGYYEKYNHENEQICIACRGASVGTINLSKKKSWITGNSMVINSDNYDDIIDKKFLYYQLMFIDFNKYISGSGQPQITRESLKNLKIKVPSLEAQQLISNILNHIDLKITIELKLLCQYQLQKAFLLKNMFV